MASRRSRSSAGRMMAAPCLRNPQCGDRVTSGISITSRTNWPPPNNVGKGIAGSPSEATRLEALHLFRLAQLIHRAAGGDRPNRGDAIAADPDIPVVEVDGRVAMARHKLDLVAELQPVRRGLDRETAVLVRSALINGGGFVPHIRRPGIESERLQARIDNRAVLGRPAHYRRPHEEARLEGMRRLAVAVEITAVIGVHEDVGAAL